jgi:hypothetical protein
MAELKITPIIPDEDDLDGEPKRRRRSPANASRGPAGRSTGARRSDPADPEEPPPAPDESIFDPEAVKDEVCRRYRMSNARVTRLTRSRSGTKSHKTGATRR